MAKTLTELRLENDMRIIEELQKKNRRYEGQIVSLQLEAYDLNKKKTAITTMHEKLRKQLHFKSLVSSKVYYGLDCDKQMQKNVSVQLRLLEHEYNRKRNMNSENAHNNEELQKVINEYRLQKGKMRESGKELEAKFAVKQDKMRDRIADANAMRLATQKVEDALEQLTTRAEAQINEQSAEIQALRDTIDGHRRAAAAIENAARTKVKSQMELFQAGLLTMEEEQEMRQKMRLLRHGIVDEAKRVEDSARRIMNHEMAFERLRKETGLADLGQIVELFVSREDDNFSLYNHLQRVEATLQQEEQKLRDLEAQSESYLENAKSRQGSVSSKYQEVEQQRDQLQTHVKAQQQVKAGLVDQQSQWNVVVLRFLREIVASGIDFQSNLLTVPATVALMDKVRETMASSLHDTQDDDEVERTARDVQAASFLNGHLEMALSLIEQCTSEIMGMALPFIHEPSMKTLNRFGMHSPSIPSSLTYERGGRWTIEPPTFSSLDDEEKSGTLTPFDSTIDRDALIASINLRRTQNDKQPRRMAKAQQDDAFLVE